MRMQPSPRPRPWVIRPILLGRWWRKHQTKVSSNMSDKSPQTVRLGVLLSGRGSNLQAIIDAIEAGTLSAEIAVVVSNKQDAAGLERARKHNVTQIWLDPKPFAGRPDSRESYDRALLDVLRKYEVDLVLLAGYMKI